MVEEREWDMVNDKIRCLMSDPEHCDFEELPDTGGRRCSLEHGMCHQQEPHSRGNGKPVDYHARKAVQL